MLLSGSEVYLKSWSVCESESEYNKHILGQAAKNFFKLLCGVISHQNNSKKILHLLPFIVFLA